MFSFIRSLFSSDKIPATNSYEKSLFEQEKNYALFLEVQESEKMRRYLELKEYVGSQNYTNELNRIKSLSFNDSHEALALKKMTGLKKMKSVKEYLNHGSNAEMPEVKEFIQLQYETGESKFIEQVKYLKNSNRHKLSDPWLCKLEYEALCKTPEIKQYFKFEKKYTTTFQEQALWVSKLYDEFTKGAVDGRWLAKPLAGEELLNKTTYALAEDLSITKEKNVSIHAGVLRIETKKEECKGLAWDKQIGLAPRTFQYTSGMATTAQSFRQLYGRFEAKIRFASNEGIQHVFWMGSDTKLPHINVIKSEGKELSVNAYAGTDANLKQENKVLKYRLDNDFYIFTFIWSEKQMIWKINGKEVHSCPNFIFEPMYIAFSSGVTKPDQQAFPVHMEIDWVRCFRTN